MKPIFIFRTITRSTFKILQPHASSIWDFYKFSLILCVLESLGSLEPLRIAVLDGSGECSLDCRHCVYSVPDSIISSTSIAFYAKGLVQSALVADGTGRTLFSVAHVLASEVKWAVELS